MVYITKGGEEHKTLCLAMLANKVHNYYIFGRDKEGNYTIIDFPCKCFCGDCVPLTKSRIDYYMERQERLEAREALLSRLKATQEHSNLLIAALSVVCQKREIPA